MHAPNDTSLSVTETPCPFASPEYRTRSFCSKWSKADRLKLWIPNISPGASMLVDMPRRLTVQPHGTSRTRVPVPRIFGLATGQHVVNARCHDHGFGRKAVDVMPDA